MRYRPIRSVIENQQILTAPAATTVLEAARSMRERKVGAVMVVDGQRLVGIFTERDGLFRVLAEGRDPQATPLAEVMTPTPQTIAPDKPVGHALLVMHEGGFRHVPVVEDGRPVGMMSARDALGPELEEFRAEVQSREHIGEILG